jgi:hypothetical protein
MDWKPITIFVLVIIVLILVVRRVSDFTDADVQKARDLFSKGMKDVDVAVALVQSGLHPDETVKVIEQAKGAPIAIVPPKSA